MRFSLRIESPVHVGDGERLGWLDWFLEGNRIHVVDWGALLAAALASHAGAAERLAAFTDRAGRFLEEEGRALAKAPGRERAEGLRRLRDQTSPVRFAADELKDEALARALRAGDHDRYALPFLGGRLDRRLEIRCHAKDRGHGPLIPASAVRGQLRSALLHAALSTLDDEAAERILSGTGPRSGWQRALAESTPGRARFLFGAELEQEVFRPPLGQGRKPPTGGPRTDLMRFLRISEPVHARASLVVGRLSPFGPARGARQSGGPRLTPLSPSLAELLEPDSAFEYEIRVDTAPLQALASSAKAGELYWHAFARLFGPSREQVLSFAPAELEERMLAALEVSLAGRMAALAAREGLWLDHLSAPADAPPRELLRAIHGAPGGGGPGGRIPLRLGMGAGLHGVSVLLALEAHPRLAEPLARALARAGLGLDPRRRRERAEREKSAMQEARQAAGQEGGAAPVLREGLLHEKTDLARLPATRRLTMEGGGPGQFLGYATIARGPLPEPRPPSARAPQQLHDPEERRAEERRPRTGRRGKEGVGSRPARPAPTARSGRAKPAPRPELPDRPATQSEIEDLLKRFGPRH